MTARLKGTHKSRPNALSDSPEFQAVIRLVAMLAGEQAIYAGPAAQTLQTCRALLLCDFRSDLAATMLQEKPETIRARVHRMRERVMEALQNLNFTLPVRPSIEQNMGRWSPETFDEHAEISHQEVPEESEVAE